MKSQITKIVSLLVCVCLIVSGMILSTSAAGSATLSFEPDGNRTSLTTSGQVWSANGITLTNTKGTSSQLRDNLNDNHIRLYQGSNVTIEYTSNMTKIELSCPTAAYAQVWDTSDKDSNTTVAVSGTTATITFANPTTSYSITGFSAQTRVNEITVYTTTGSGSGSGGNGGSTPFDPTNKTAAEIMTAAKALTGSETIANVTLTGTIKSVDYSYSSTAKNLTVTIDVEGTSDSLKCYKLTADNANLETLAGLAEGDKITVNGTIGVYNNTPQFTEGAKMTACVKNPTPPAPEPELEVVTAPVAGTAYKFGMVQGNVNNTIYYLKGDMNGHYMDTTDKGSKAIDVYLEETTGGYYLYTLDGTTKTYINMVVNGTYVNGAYEATASTVYTYDATSKTIIATVTVGTYEPSPYWFGTRNDNTYTTVGPCLTKYNGFYCQFYAEKATDNNGNQGGNTNTGAGTNTGANTNTNTNTGSTTTTTPAPEKSPETGDSIALYIVMMAISAAAMVLVAKKRFA